MITSISVSELEGAITSPELAPTPGSSLTICPVPQRFVAPRMSADGSSATQVLGVEIIFIEASAAVGKSTFAEHLSGTRNVPLLNLAKTRVSTGAFSGLLSNEFSNSSEAQCAFHEGRLPIIIDALDEGRIYSGESHIEDFLQTTLAFIRRDRSHSDKPKLIFLGRPESRALAEASIGLYGGDVSVSWLTLDFFDEAGARELINVYALGAAPENAAYHSNPGPVGELIDSYFSSIATALGLDEDELWSSTVGPAFAGYAPVLAAIGELLAKVTNFIEVTNRLKNAESQEAWGVMRTVVDGILIREQRDKFVPALAQRTGQQTLPNEAYDPEEQLRFLVRFIDGQPLAPSGRVALDGNDMSTYLSMVKQLLSDHPFIREGRFANSVLASVALAYGVSNGLLQGNGLRVLESESRNPFLWRSLAQALAGSASLIDGRYAGLIFRSFWSDPLTSTHMIRVRNSADDGVATAEIPAHSSASTRIQLMLPMSLYGHVVDCDIDVAGDIKLEGERSGGGSAFRFIGTSAMLTCQELDIDSDSIIFSGCVWIGAKTARNSARLELTTKPNAQYGWGPSLTESYPWSALQPILQRPNPGADGLTALLKACSERFPPGQPLVLYSDLNPVEDDPHTRWLAKHGTTFSDFIQLLLDHNLASTTSKGAQGPRPKIDVSLRVNWSSLYEALVNPTAGTESERAFLAIAKQRLSS